MVAAAPYVSAAVTLTHAVKYASTGFPIHHNTTRTSIIYKTVTVCPCTDSLATLATSKPTSSYNPNGPYNNPYDHSSLPFSWPGKPSKGASTAPPKPTPPFPYGGPGRGGYDAPAWIPKGVHSLVPGLPEGAQNGNSPWGEISCPHLPITGLPGHESTGLTISLPTATGSYMHHGNGTKTSVSATASATKGACPTMPDTGVTRTYDLHVAYQTIAPDGVTRNGLTINGQFPGPLIEANWGDWILMKVTNDLTDEGTTLHAHGLFQKGTPWYDGVPAVGQCPITPQGGSLNMLFRADQYGSSWYHSHYSAQYSGGAHGPMVIYGPKHADYDIDIGPIILEDWFHQDYFTLVNQTMQGNFPPSNNNLINGKMNYPCQNTTLPCTPNAGLSKFKFESGKKHLLRLMNMGAEGTQKFSIDNHTMTIIANDYVPIEPYSTNVVTLGIGQRADVIVEATGNPSDAFWMRSQLGTELCTLNDGVSPNAVAVVYYEDADTTSVPNTTSDVTAAQLAICKNDPLNQTIPLCKITPPEPAVTERIDITFGSNGTNFIWFMNNSSFRGDYNDPILEKVNKGNRTFEPQWNVLDFGSNSSVRIHLVNHGLIGGHPMHLHGHDFWVLAEGFGEWDGTITNPGNPSRRDVQILQNGQDADTPSYMVLEFAQDNPGVWPLHCHLAWHVSGGLYVNVLERPDDIEKMKIDENMFEGCTAWDAYTSGNAPDQIDSGL